MLLHNENKLDEMSLILDHYMKLVPLEGYITHPRGGVLEFDDTRFFPILFGGDQLTVVRVRGTQALRDTTDYCVDRLEGVAAVVEDWHARMALVRVSLII